MVLRIKLTVFRTADFALCLVLAGRFPAGVLSQLLAAIITLVVFVIVCTLADYIIADITFVVFVCIDAILGFRMAGVTLTDSGVGLFIAVLRPSAPVVAQHIAGEEGRLIRRALGAQTAGCAGLVVDRLFGTGCSRLQILRLCFFGSEAVCCHLAVFAAADRTDSLVRAVCRAAVAILGFRMAGVTLTDSGVGLFIAVLRPSAPVVAQHIAGEEGRLIRRALGAQTAGCAGLVVDRLFGTGCSRLQILRLCFFGSEAVCCHLAVFAAADRTDSLVRAVCRAAVAILGFRMAGVTLTDSGVGLFIAVLRPSAPVVAQHIAGEEGRLIRRALGAQTAGCAGLVVDRLFGTGCSRLQILRLCFFGSEAVCCHLAVFAAADRTDSLVRAVCRAAVAILGFRMAGVTLTDSGVGLFIAVLRPSAPVVVQHSIRCGKRISVVGAYFTARTG